MTRTDFGKGIALTWVHTIAGPFGGGSGEGLAILFDYNERMRKVIERHQM